VVVWGAVSAAAAEPGLEVHLQPQRFGLEDVAQLTIRVNEPPSDLRTPGLGELVNLQLVAGPSTGSEFTFVNGVASRATTFTYVLRGVEPGPASVGPISVGWGRNELTAEAVTAEVVEGSVAPPSRRARSSPFSADPFGDIFPRRAPPRVELVLRHVFSDRGVTVGQPLVATVFLDSTVSAIDRFNWQVAPSYPGFWAQRVDSPDQVMPEVVDVEGTRFYRYPVLRHVLVPLKAGTFEVPAVEAAIGVRTRSLFDPGQVIDRSTPVTTIDVADRPAPPAGFSGAVGNLRYSAKLEPTEIEYGESAVLTVKLEGRGNLPLVEAPALWPSCAACDAYPPEEASDISVDETGIRGSRSWQVTVVPQGWGRLELEAVELAVFDPASGSFSRQVVGPLALRVNPPPPTPTPVVTPVPDARVPGVHDEAGSDDTPEGVPSWVWIAGALSLGLLAGGGATWVLTRRPRTALPPRRADQSPAERARELQLVLERWWLDARSTGRGAALEEDMQHLRRDIEAVRFAPGRADHSHTVVDLETRLRSLIRRA
jgi:hypothetical protein